MNQKVIQFYKFLSEETQSLRQKLKQEIIKGEEKKAIETKKELIELNNILKFFDGLKGRFTDPQEGNYKTPQERKGVSFSEGDNVLYVGTYFGTVQSDRTVLLTDGTVIGSLDSQPHKFRAVI